MENKNKCFLPSISASAENAQRRQTSDSWEHALSLGLSQSLQEFWRFSPSLAPEKAHLCHLRSSPLCPMPCLRELFSSRETAACVGANGNNRRWPTTAVSEARLLNFDKRWSRCVPDTYDWHNGTKQTRPTFVSPEFHRLSGWAICDRPQSGFKRRYEPRNRSAVENIRVKAFWYTKAWLYFGDHRCKTWS